MIIRRLIAFIALLAVSPLFASDWPLHRGNAAQIGVSDEKLPENLGIRWQFATKNAIEGGPVIADGVVYVGSADKNFYAIDLKTGQQKWKVPLGIITSAPGIKGDRVYTGNADGKFFCLKRENGDTIWTFETDGQITAAPNFAENNVLIASQDSVLYCLDKDGKKVWDFRIEGPIYGGVAVADGKTFLAGCDSMMHVLDVKTGKELGNVDLQGQSGSSAAVFGDHLYVGTMSNQVVSVNLTKLKIEWAFEAPKRKQGFYGSAAVTDDLVVIGSRDEKVWAIDRKTGKARWDFLTDHKVDGSAVIVGERIFIGSFDKHFYVLDMKGQKLADFELDGAILGAPGVADGCVLIGTEKGTVYCFGAK
jgi:outer membrane protein assembly factor BamB